MQLDQPGRGRPLSPGGATLTADLRAAADALWRLASTRRDQTYRASLTLAVILAVLDQKDAAVAAATRALEVSPYSPRGYLIRARVRYFGGDYQGARDDVDRGLAIQFNEPGLLELKGILRAAAGDYNAALESLRRGRRLWRCRPHPSAQGGRTGGAGPGGEGRSGMVAGTAGATPSSPRRISAAPVLT